MEQYKDKKKRSELLVEIKNIKLLGGIFQLEETMYPGWIFKTYQRYSDKKSNDIWFQTCRQFKTTPKQIIVVDFLYFDNKARVFRINLSDKRYMTGTINKVKKVANVSPNITVHAIGPQKRALSPPKKI